MRAKDTPPLTDAQKVMLELTIGSIKACCVSLLDPLNLIDIPDDDIKVLERVAKIIGAVQARAINSTSQETEAKDLEEEAVKAEEALYRRLMFLLDVTWIPGIGPLWDTLTKQKFSHALTCYRETVVNLLCGFDIPTFHKAEKSPKKTSKKKVSR